MNWLIRLLLSAVSVILAAYILRGVHVDGFLTAILIALVMGLLNVFIRPLLVILTIPITILTFGLFLLVVNAIIVMLVDALIGGFVVEGFGWAILFSLIVSFFSYLLGIRQISQNKE